MKLQYRTLPRQASKTIREWNKQFSGADLFGMRSIGNKRQTIESHPLYYLGLLAVVTGQDLSSATIIGWRHLREDQHGFSELTVEHISDRKFRVSRATRFPKDHPAIRAHHRLHSKKLTGSKAYEVRALTIPPLVSLAIWLKSAKESKIIPIHSVIDTLPAGKIINEEIFLKNLLQPSRELLESVPEPYQIKKVKKKKK